MGEYIYFLKMICYNEVQYYTTGEYTNLDPRSRSRITDDYMQYRRSLSSNIFLLVLFLFWQIFSWGFASFTVKLFFFICNFSVAIQFCLPNMESKKFEREGKNIHMLIHIRYVRVHCPTFL